MDSGISATSRFFFLFYDFGIFSLYNTSLTMMTTCTILDGRRRTPFSYDDDDNDWDPVLELVCVVLLFREARESCA